ncbi:hypothetical protein L1887_36137 [Cichorium endivia]|nr:hypothetical protein L1887_36137 [Cichorium endivia]
MIRSSPYCVLYLSVVYQIFIPVYIFFLAYSISVYPKSEPAFRKIHKLMAGLFLMKLLEYMLADIFVDLYVYFSPIVSIVRLPIVINMVYSGLSLLDPFLYDADQSFLRTTIPLQVLVEIVNIGVTGPIRFDFLGSDYVILFLYVLVLWKLVVMALANLFATINDMRTMNIRIFYLLVICYMIVRSIINYIKNKCPTEACTQMVKYTLLEETIGVVYYASLLKTFRKCFGIADHED